MHSHLIRRCGTRLRSPSALDKAHRQGITHRDLKPGNIMLTKAGAKLLDFGLAKASASTIPGAALSMLPTTPANLTAQGSILGTLQYMAPEQLEGQEADARTDIFAFGAVLYEMLAGNRAFEGKSHASLIASILTAEPPAISSLQPLTPPLVDRLVRRCLAKHSDDRFQSACDVLIVLRWANEPGIATIVPGDIRQRPIGQFAYVAAVVLALACAGLTMLYIRAVRSTAVTSPGVAPVSRLIVPLPPTAAFVGTVGGVHTLAISPDGTQIVYTAQTPNGIQLYRRRLDRFEAEPVPGTEGARGPFFSPDGRRIGFLAREKGLGWISSDGSLPMTIGTTQFNASRGATWARDNIIVFGAFGGGLWRVSADGGAATPATSLDAAQREISHRFPYALPDGRTILYAALPSDPSQGFAGRQDFSLARIIAHDMKTGARKVLLSGGMNPVNVSGGELVFARSNALYAVPFDVDTTRLVGDPVEVLRGVQTYTGNGFADFAVSTSGSLVYARGEDTGGVGTTLVWVDRQGVERPLAQWQTQFNAIRLSPDGSHVVVHRNSVLSNVAIYDVSRATLTTLTFEDAGTNAPVWSPDGRKIVLTRPDPAISLGPYTLVSKSADASGTEERLVERTSPISASSWSPDGKWIAFTEETAQNRSHIWLLPMEGDRKPVPFVTSAASEQNPRFSPDSHFIAYQVQ